MCTAHITFTHIHTSAMNTNTCSHIYTCKGVHLFTYKYIDKHTDTHMCVHLYNTYTYSYIIKQRNLYLILNREITMREV